MNQHFLQGTPGVSRGEGTRVSSLMILMIEVEQPEGISARKLVVEAAKHNVITAYTGAEGIELFRRFPNADAVLIHADLPECDEVIRAIREIRPEVPTIVATPVPDDRCTSATYVVPSHDPEALLHLLAREFGASTKN